MRKMALAVAVALICTAVPASAADLGVSKNQAVDIFAKLGYPLEKTKWGDADANSGGKFHFYGESVMGGTLQMKDGPWHTPIGMINVSGANEVADTIIFSAAHIITNDWPQPSLDQAGLVLNTFLPDWPDRFKWLLAAVKAGNAETTVHGWNLHYEIGNDPEHMILVITTKRLH